MPTTKPAAVLATASHLYNNTDMNLFFKQISMSVGEIMQAALISAQILMEVLCAHVGLGISLV